MEFTASIKEVNRRKKAFLVLLSSVFIGTFFASLLFNYQINAISYLFIVALFCFFYFLILLFFISISRTRLRIDNEKIEKIKGRIIQTVKLSQIKEIKVKRRTNGIIREMYIFLHGRKSIIITAFEESFESIFIILKDKTDGAASIKETKELIDFDHFLFYPILGLLISFSSIGFFKLMGTASVSTTKIILSVFAVYIFILSLYFIIEKPISAREVQGKNKITDYLMGIIMFCCAMFVVFIILNY